MVLPEYRGSDSVAIYAVYPCRDFMPEKVNVFIEYLAELYGNEPYWNMGLDLSKFTAQPGKANPKVVSLEDAPARASR